MILHTHYAYRRTQIRTRGASNWLAVVAVLLAVFDAHAKTPAEEPEEIPTRLVAFVGPNYTSFSLSSLHTSNVSWNPSVSGAGLAGLDLRVGAELLKGELCLLVDLVVAFASTERSTTSITARSETELSPAEITTSSSGMKYLTTLWQLGLSGRWNGRTPRPETMVPFIGGRVYYEYMATDEEWSGPPSPDVSYTLNDPITHGFGVQLSLGLEYLFNRHLGLGVEGLLGYGARYHEENTRTFNPGTSGWSSDAESKTESDATRTEHGLSWRTILTLSFRL